MFTCKNAACWMFLAGDDSGRLKVELSLKIHECFVTLIPPRADDELQSKEEGGGGQ